MVFVSATKPVIEGNCVAYNSYWDGEQAKQVYYMQQLLRYKLPFAFKQKYTKSITKGK